MFKWFMLLMQSMRKSAFDKGAEFAKERLKTGDMTREELEEEAYNAFDFNDFDRGVLSVCRSSKAFENLDLIQGRCNAGLADKRWKDR